MADMIEQALWRHQSGDLAQAEALYLRVIAAQPAHPQAIHNLSLILAVTGRAREAQRRLERLVKQAPGDAAAHLLLGRLLGEDGKATRSQFLLRRATALVPERIEVWLDAMAALGAQRLPGEAAKLATQAATRFPTRPELALQAGLAWMNNGDDAQARPWFEQALRIDPDHAPALYQLATVQEALGDTAAALRLYRRAQLLDMRHALKPICLGDLELRLGDVNAAIASLDRWLETHPRDEVAISNRLLAAQYVPGITAASLRRLHTLWQERIGAPLQTGWQPHDVTLDPDRPLRVGLVSGDLRAHPVGLMTIPGIEGLDVAHIHLVIYADSPSQDAIATRFRRRAALWRDTQGWSDARLAEAVRTDRIDILIDLAGHTTNIRLAAFARRPAPVQLSWAGYFGTSGCAAIDGLIVDPQLVPAGEEADYDERVLRLPDGYLCYDPPGVAPDVTPRDPSAPLRFAAFHHPAKINAEIMALWARVLAEADPSQQASLHFTYAGYDVPEVQVRITGWFTAAGGDAARLRFTGALPLAAYYARLGEMDIGLDPQPYSGGAITCDCLWMGVPVVTLPGRSAAGRHAQTHLTAAGLGEFVARDADDYVAIIRRLALDRAHLAEIHAGLRDRVAGSALCDGQRFGRNLETLLRTEWRRYCAAALS